MQSQLVRCNAWATRNKFISFVCAPVVCPPGSSWKNHCIPVSGAVYFEVSAPFLGYQYIEIISSSKLDLKMLESIVSVLQSD